MRVLFLTNLYPPHELGGYEQLCQEVAVHLTARGHHLSVLTSRFGISNLPDDASAEVVRRLYLETDVNYYHPLEFFLHRLHHEHANVVALQQRVSEFSPDAILIWGMWNLSLRLPYLAETLLPGRVMYYISSYWPIDVDPHRAYWQAPARRKKMELLKRLLRACAMAELRREAYPPHLRFDHAVCCSNYVRNTLVDAGAIPPTVGVIRLGIDPMPFLRHGRATVIRPDDSPLNLLYSGRLIWDKGVHTAIQAMKILADQGLAARFHLTVLGSGHPDYEAALRRMVKRYQLTNNVQFVRQISRDQMPEWLGRYEVFLFTSIWPEPMARTVMEAMAAGLVVIGTAVGGQAEMMVNEHNSLVYAPEDAHMLATAIASIAHDPEKMKRLACAGQAMVADHFTIRHMVDAIEQRLYALTEVNSDPSEMTPAASKCGRTTVPSQPTARPRRGR